MTSLCTPVHEENGIPYRTSIFHFVCVAFPELIDLKLECYGNRSVARLRILNERTHYAADRWRVKA